MQRDLKIYQMKFKECFFRVFISVFGKEVTEFIVVWEIESDLMV